MAIYRGEGGATDVEPAPGDTEFAGGIIVEEDIVGKGKITAEEGFYGDGSALTNLPNDNVWKDNGQSIEFNGNGGSDTEVWAVNNGKKAQMTILSNGLTYFTGDGPTYFGTGADEVVKIITNGTAQLAVSSIGISAFQPVTAPSFIGDGGGLTGLPDSGIPDAPDDGVLYGRKDSSWETIAVGDNVYTKAEIDAQQNAQDADIIINNDEIARQQIEITNNTSEIDKNDTAINTNITNIASNTTAIGTLSGQVSQNSEDIEELQDSIFFTSAYSADYPSSPNRDPENGNMYLQAFALFTYSYAAATQIFCSKTDESGNVRQFTAVKPGDSIVLNEVDSPNYGRYELVTVEDVSDSYVVMNVIPKMGQGTVITGVKVAFQAFPQPGGGTGEGTVADGCIYLNNQTVTADYTIPAGKNGMSSGPIKFDGTVTIPDGSAYHVVDSDEDSLWSDVGGKAIYLNDVGIGTSTPSFNSGTGLEIKNADGLGGHLKLTDSTSTIGGAGGFDLYAFNTNGYIENFEGGLSETIFRNNGNQSMSINSSNQVEIEKDITVNGVTVGKGGNSGETNTAVGGDALFTNNSGLRNTAVGMKALLLNEGGNENTAIGSYALQSVTTGSVNTAIGDSAISGLTEGSENTGVGNASLTGLSTGSSNTALGRSAGSTISTGSNNTCIGYKAQPSAPGVYNEVTIGNDSVTSTRLKGAVNFNAIPDLQPLDTNTRIYTQSGVGAIYDSYSHNFRVGASGSTVGLSIANNGTTTTKSLTTQGNITTTGSATIGTMVSAGGTPVVVNGAGTLLRSSTFFMTEEAVDKKLEIIEKLEARLTKLEARIK